MLNHTLGIYYYNMSFKNQFYMNVTLYDIVCNHNLGKPQNVMHDVIYHCVPGMC